MIYSFGFSFFRAELASHTLHKSLSTQYRCVVGKSPAPSLASGFGFLQKDQRGQSPFPSVYPKRPAIASVAQREGLPFAGQQFISPLALDELFIFALHIWKRISNFSKEN